MRNSAAIRERYLRDGLPVRLGGLAANLARVSSRSRNTADEAVVGALIEECKWFIEWTAADFLPDSVDAAAQLVELQIELAGWQAGWCSRWPDDIERARMGATARRWSERLLEMSGLLGRPAAG
jgi:hypothetical protein